MTKENKFWTKEDNIKRRVEIPNEIFDDLREWLGAGDIKSPMHQEFVYSYYWLISYLWKYAEYNNFNINQKSIKQILLYSPNEKRINYLIKKNGILDVKGYTQSIRDFPISWERKGRENIEFYMYSNLSKDEQNEYYVFPSNTSHVKSPYKSLKENVFNKRGNSHLMSGELFKVCMENKKLGCAGFFILGYFTHLRSLSVHYNQNPVFNCSNQTLIKKLGWSEKRIIKLTSELRDSELIKKWQPEKKKGSVNLYKLLF